jgi:hypothetical protein
VIQVTPSLVRGPSARVLLGASGVLTFLLCITVACALVCIFVAPTPMVLGTCAAALTAIATLTALLFLCVWLVALHEARRSYTTLAWRFRHLWQLERRTGRVLRAPGEPYVPVTRAPGAKE